MPDGDGTMLDHSILLYGSNMSNSNAHNHYPLPTADRRRRWKTIKGGQHLKYPDQTPLSNLLLTIARPRRSRRGEGRRQHRRSFSEV